MGNQLFNYACGYAQARRDGDSLVLDISECDNSTLRDFELDKRNHFQTVIWDRRFTRT